MSLEELCEKIKEFQERIRALTFEERLTELENKCEGEENISTENDD